VKAYHDLLGNVLPPSISRRLRDEPGFVADRIKNATILFSDIVGFVPFARDRPANEVVGILDDIFRGFDQRCTQGCLEKIKTIGDAYMLAGGLYSVEDPADAAIRVVSAGMDFFGILEQVNEYHNLDLQLRIGVNSGSLIAGVIGESRLSYDLWGDTVNLASRMESHGRAGHIQLSANTRELIGDRFPLLPQGPREIKGRGEMETWLISGTPSPWSPLKARSAA
jgi:class 3 adenylate cyclase